MNERKTSPELAQLLSETHWAIPKEKSTEMMHEYLNRNTPCSVCKRSRIIFTLTGSLHCKCTEKLSPRAGCLLFELDKDRLYIGNEMKEDTR